MLVRQPWLCGGLVAGGGLVAAGAALPWLTLYAGFQHYSGLIGVYGWAILAAGAFSCAGGCAAVRLNARWLHRTGAMLGTAVFAFGAWLYAGLMQIVHRQDAVMLVPRPGPGLYLVLIGAACIVAASILQAREFAVVRGGRSR